MDDIIKRSFEKVKEDMNSIKYEIDYLKTEIKKINNNLFYITSILNSLANNLKNQDNQENNTCFNSLDTSTDRQTNQTDRQHFLDTSTDNYALEDLKSNNLMLSNGNKGVPTDRQTDRQTDRHIILSEKNNNNNNSIYTDSFVKDMSNSEETHYPKSNNETNNKTQFNKNNTINNAVEIIDSLDNIKKELRIKFKRLTDQEFIVFTTLYQLEEQNKFTDYKTLSKKLNLTESSIRDYIGRLIKKEVPVEKEKINNKSIHLKISENLKKIVSLPTLIQLRDL